MFDYSEHVVNSLAKFDTSLSPLMKGMKGTFTALF